MLSFPEVAQPRCSIIILTWRRTDLAMACLAALHAHRNGACSFEVILVLNGAPDDARDRILAAYSGVVLVDSVVNMGFSAGCNLGAEHAHGEYLVLLNDDTIAEPDWLERLVATADANPSAGAVASEILGLDGRIQEAGSIIWRDGRTQGVGRGISADHFAWHYVRRVDYGSACALLVRTTTWNAVHGLDEIYSPAYFEDVDLCLKIQALGQHILFEPRARVRHHESASSDDELKMAMWASSHAKFIRRWQAELEEREPAHADAWSVDRAAWRARGCPRRVLIVDEHLAVASKGSGLGRMADILIELSDAGFAVSFFALNGKGPLADDLIDRGVALVQEPIDQHVARPEIWYDIVVISRPACFPLAVPIRIHQPWAKLVYDCEALSWRRLVRQVTLTTDPTLAEQLTKGAETMREQEERFARHADLTIAVSAEEALLLRAAAQGRPVRVVPPVDRIARVTTRRWHERRGIGYVAGWLAGSGSPNADGLRWFLADVFPAIVAAIPWAQLRITGANPPDEFRDLNGPNIVFEGHVAHLHQFYDEIRVAISPARFGAGVKIKTIQAMQYAVPTVSTSIGAEGILDDPSDALIVVDEAVAFGAAVISLLTNEAAWSARYQTLLALAGRWSAANDGRAFAESLESLWNGAFDDQHAGVRSFADDGPE